MTAHNGFGVAPGDREVYLWGAPVELSKQDRLKALRDRLTNQLLLSAFAMSPEAMADYVSRIERKIVLIDGIRLAELMIDHSVGVETAHAYVLKKVDLDYFAEET